MTERTSCSFSVKRGVNDNDFFLAIEPYDDSIETLSHGFIGFEFSRKIDADKAKEIEKFFNKNISYVTFTKFTTKEKSRE